MELDFSEQIKDLVKNSKRNSCVSFSECISSVLEVKAKEHNEESENQITLDQLKKVYRRGYAVYSHSHLINKTRGQLALARVNNFLKLVKGREVSDSYYLADKDIVDCEETYYVESAAKAFVGFTDLELDLACIELIKAGIEKWDQNTDCEELFYSEAEKKTLNKPFRLKGEKKKFGVYVKNPKTGNVIVVKFGDPNMEIKRDDPDRRRSFRARHKCDTAKDKTTPRYWSCKMWSKKPVNKSVSSEALEWDEEELISEWGWDESSVIEDKDYFKDFDHLKDCKIVEEEDV